MNAISDVIPLNTEMVARVDFGTSLVGGLWRNTLRLKRNRASLVSAFVIPGIVFTAFWLVFGHAARQSGVDYALYILPAVMFQAALFSAGGSMMALAVDVESGILGRLRSMPIAPWVIIASRLGTDLIRSVASIATVVTIALICGARPDSAVGLMAACVIALLVGEVMAMLFCGAALRSNKPIVTSGIVQGVEVPLLMLSSGFIPVQTLSDWVRPFVEHQPFSPIIDSLRAILVGENAGGRGWEAFAWLFVGLVLGSIWVTRALRRLA